MNRSVVISGLGVVSAAGQGVEALWSAVVEGRSFLAPIAGFDASGFDCRIAAEVREFSINAFVPKSYRKATKVMARDIQFAVAAADLAARDAGLATRAVVGEGSATTYPGERMGCHVGAGLIACEVDELTGALAESRAAAPGGDGRPRVDVHHWGREGINSLTPLWLLKYLPNMLACHVTILHDAQGPSNTITCGDASGLLSIGESLRVVQRGDADLCFCGGAESKLNPMAFYRQLMVDRLTRSHHDAPAGAIRPFDRDAAGTAVGEGGGIVVLESADTLAGRRRPYARVIGFGAGQTVHPAQRNRVPDAGGRGLLVAARSALREAGIGPDAIDLVVSFGIGHPAFDSAEAAALRTLFGPRLATTPVVSTKPAVGMCGAGGGGLDVAVAALAIQRQTVPAIVNRPRPLEGLGGESASHPAVLRHALVLSSSIGGQNAALVLGPWQG